MAFGKITQEISYNQSTDKTLEDLKEALSRIGKVKSVDPDALLIKGKTRFGLQTVKIEATINGDDENSVISFVGKSDDIKGVGAKKGLEHLIETMGNLDDPNYKVSKTGLDGLQWTYLLSGILGLIVFLIMLNVSLPWVADNKTAISLLFAAYVGGYFKIIMKK